MANPAKTVHPINFKDFSGEQFERLVFAYHLRTERWRCLDWYGQVGSDLGRDIWGVREDDALGVKTCIQCANRGSLTYKKASQDLNKAITGPQGKPSVFRIVCRSAVSADMRDRIKGHAKGHGVTECDIWSGVEFEERLRMNAEPLLARFVQGVEFPDAADHLSVFVLAMNPANDKEAIRLMARLFDRPAFYTPIREESKLPDFKQAISDTIKAMNTGIWQARDGKDIARLPSLHQIVDDKVRQELGGVVRGLVRLRATYDQLVADGELRPCACGKPDCPVYMMSHRAIRDLGRARSEPVGAFTRLCHQLGVSVNFGWR